MLNVQRALVALILVAGVTGHAAEVKADAMSDQKKALKAAGIKIQPVTQKCTIFTKSDAERVFRQPVVHVETELDKTDCAYGLAKDPSVGVNVSRGSRSDWYPPKPGDMATSQIHHIRGVGEDAYTSYANAGAGGVYSADVLTSKGVTSVTLAEGAGNADTALAIARMVMNR
jgi:hypothetical protein